ncbi:unnamed protein product, partial [Cuscuta campestris]
TKEPVEEASSDDDNEFGLVIKKFHKFMKKEFERKGRKHDGPPKCYGCGEIGHIKPRCPKAKHGKDKFGFKKQRAYISWGGDSGDESTDQEEDEAANLCLMAHEDQSDDVQEDDIRLFHVLLNDVKFDWVHFFIVALSDGTRFSHLRFAIPIMHILAHCKIDFTRDTQVPVKKTCFITEAKFSRIVYREEGDAAPNLDLIVAEEEEESQNENQAESSQAGGSRATERVTRQRRTRPREEASEPSWVKKIFDTLTCIRDDVRQLNERMTRLEQSRSYRGPRHSFGGGARPANSL